MERCEEAEPYHRESLANYRRVLGDDHFNTLLAINNMGSLLLDMERPAEAEVLAVEAIVIATRTLDPHHPVILTVLTNHGRVLAELERFAESEERYLQAYDVGVESQGPDDQQTIDIARTLVRFYTLWHEAEPGGGHDATAAEWRAKLPPDEGPTDPDGG